uniref:Uncharacterized protein n=1 Tax=Plectus sambesii TaxID=2011161 RepID=A0A914WXQ8_9BILA
MTMPSTSAAMRAESAKVQKMSTSSKSARRRRARCKDEQRPLQCLMNGARPSQNSNGQRTKMVAIFPPDETRRKSDRSYTKANARSPTRTPCCETAL